MGNESLLVGTIATNVNFKIHVHVLSQSSYVGMFLGGSAYVYDILGWISCKG
jgi:hypothetical protein